MPDPPFLGLPRYSASRWSAGWLQSLKFPLEVPHALVETNESRCMSQTKFANVCKSEMQNSFVHNMTVVICGYFVSFRPFTNSGFCIPASKVAANGSWRCLFPSSPQLQIASQENPSHQSHRVSCRLAKLPRSRGVSWKPRRANISGFHHQIEPDDRDFHMRPPHKWREIPHFCPLIRWFDHSKIKVFQPFIHALTRKYIPNPDPTGVHPHLFTFFVFSSPFFNFICFLARSVARKIPRCVSHLTRQALLHHPRRGIHGVAEEAKAREPGRWGFCWSLKSSSGSQFSSLSVASIFLMYLCKTFVYKYVFYR